MVQRQENKFVLDYRISIDTTSFGTFKGPLTVPMRSFTPADVVKACLISSRFPMVHGAPVHVGRPDRLGIGDLAKHDYGEPVGVPNNHIPVFWACGVTPHAVVTGMDMDLCITHAPSHIVVTDGRASEYCMS